MTSSIYGFTIDDSKVQIIEQEGFTTYTFFAFREQTDLLDYSILENYVYKEFADGSYSQFLISYVNCVIQENGVINCDDTGQTIITISDDDLMHGRGCEPEFIDLATTIVCYDVPCTGGDNHVLGDEDYSSCALVLVHESIHAELLERCIQLGIITSAGYGASNWQVLFNFSNGQIIQSDLGDILFATLVDQYSSYNGGPLNSNWQHDMFNVLGYRDRIIEDLNSYHLLLDDPLNPFENHLNNNGILILVCQNILNYLRGKV
ncbi:hypothetical protein [Psychroserpens damuponensis]|uniref:hypothetical protein n=1 Tax=Psychroserpens damuponensis TaxID=943936 RepID=UPI00058BE7E6|nr:hypothetical protein [Psychroserpens damuponensis]